MSDNQKKQGFIEKLKSTKVNRASLITAVVLIAAIAVIISVTVISNRSKKDPIPDDTKAPEVNDTDTPEDPTETDAPDETEPPQSNTKPSGGSAQVQNKLPSFVLPTSGTLAEKHDPELQVYSNTLEHYRVHLGIDIATEENAPVYAAADGTISKIWNDELMGYCMAIKHSGNSYTFYKNLSDELPTGIKEGSSVRSGQVIANVGDSALVEIAEEPHLHFEMTVADLSVDPLAYFGEAALKSLNVSTSDK